MQQKFTFKRDKYKKARGGYSRLLNIYCKKCKNFIVLYQKDGPGNLKRLYFDRIFLPKNLINLQHEKLDSIPNLKCNKCKRALGMPEIYKKENRKSFRLFQDAVSKKVTKLIIKDKNN